jgi:hypothetical protein
VGHTTPGHSGRCCRTLWGKACGHLRSARPCRRRGRAGAVFLRVRALVSTRLELCFSDGPGKSSFALNEIRSALFLPRLRLRHSLPAREARTLWNRARNLGIRRPRLRKRTGHSGIERPHRALRRRILGLDARALRPRRPAPALEARRRRTCNAQSPRCNASRRTPTECRGNSSDARPRHGEYSQMHSDDGGTSRTARRISSKSHRMSNASRRSWRESGAARARLTWCGVTIPGAGGRLGVGPAPTPESSRRAPRSGGRSGGYWRPGHLLDGRARERGPGDRPAVGHPRRP